MYSVTLHSNISSQEYLVFPQFTFFSWLASRRCLIGSMNINTVFYFAACPHSKINIHEILVAIPWSKSRSGSLLMPKCSALFLFSPPTNLHTLYQALTMSKAMGKWSTIKHGGKINLHFNASL